MMKTPFSLPALEIAMKSSTCWGPLQADQSWSGQSECTRLKKGKIRLTGPYGGIFGKEIAVVLPLGGVTIHRPALAELRDSKAVAEFVGSAVDVRIALAMGVDRRSHDAFGCDTA
jgi:hypothetical protein